MEPIVGRASSLAADPIEPEVIVAAGLLQAAGGLGDTLSLDAATERLRELLTPAAVWVSEPLRPRDADRSIYARLGRVPRWRQPGAAITVETAAIVRRAWESVMPPPQWDSWGQPVLRLRVRSLTEAQQLTTVGSVGPRRLVPSLPMVFVSRLSWRWPLRVGVAAGVRSEAWLAQLRESPFVSLFDAQPIDEPTRDRFDIVLVDAHVGPRVVTSACVILMSDTQSAAELVDLGLERFRRVPIVAGVPSGEVAWFDAALREMAHDQPIDVALQIAVPSSVIAGDEGFLNVTAVRQWALEVEDSIRPRYGDGSDPTSARAELRHVVLSSVFDAERHGAADVVAFVRGLDAAGFETEFEERLAKAEAPEPEPPRMESATRSPVPAPPPPEEAASASFEDTAASGGIAVPETESPHAEFADESGAVAFPGPAPSPSPASPPRAVPPAPAPAAAPPPASRHLIADAWADGVRCAETLRPDADHALVVRIAIPTQGQTHATTVFPVAELPDNSTVQLMVHVSSDELGLRASKPIVLSTAEPAKASTQAVFPFRTHGDDSTVDIKILVTYQNRPLQECHYVTTVRSQAFPGDRPEINTIQLSSWHEPRKETTAAEISLEVNGANLINTETGRAVDLSQLRPLLDLTDGTASRTMADDDAPERLEGAAATALLVKLARRGAQLKTFLAPLGIDAKTTVSLLVDATTPVLPLELVYDRPVPDETTARICEHRADGAKVGVTEICPDAGREVVCPLAFWGQHRVIARTFRLPPKAGPRVPPAPLNLRPILYAATTKADEGVQDAVKASDLLEAELKTLTEPGAVTRVEDWPAWARAVEQSHPQLLVVLGHTESRGDESMLEIGDGSFLKSPSVTSEFLRADPAAPPLVILLACSTALPRDCFGGLPGAFAGGGAAAVVATLTKMHGPHGARAGVAIARALFEHGVGEALTLGDAMTAARRRLISEGLLVGLLLVSHGEIDLRLRS